MADILGQAVRHRRKTDCPSIKGRRTKFDRGAVKLGDSRIFQAVRERLTNGARPWFLAYSLAREMTHAGVSDTPR